MTTYTPSHSYNQIPEHPDQPTPQSPPASFMSSHAAGSMTADKYNNHQQSYSSASSPPNSFSGSTNGPRPAVQTSANSLLTPSSTSAPNSAHGDMEVDSIEDCFSDGNSNKRRRTYGSFDAERRSVPPNLRHDTDDKRMVQIRELITQPDCSPYHLVLEKPHPRLYPDPRDDLISLYGLQPIAEKVARFDASGKKNRLRKSYKGYITGISGKNEVIARPSNLSEKSDRGLPPGEYEKEYRLKYLVGYPEENWHLTNVLGKEKHKFDMGKLRRSLAGITKGEIPGFDASILGLDDELPKKRIENARSPAVTVGTPQLNGSTSTPGNASTISGGRGDGEDLRPKRQKKRRRYDDASYEGYEGYDEDDAGATAGNGPGGGSSWDGDRDKKKKKRKKDVDSPGGMDIGRHSVPVYGR